jgi:E3 SUMO-protein ligase PIAS1
MLQEQAPTWTCPICNKTISFNGLAVDQYVQEILSKVKNVDQVTIEASGEWSTGKATTPPRHGPQDDSDDDVIEVSDYRVSAIKEEAALTPTSLSTPPLPSREASTVPRSGTKRTAEVVDLTLSDDAAFPIHPVATNCPPSGTHRLRTPGYLPCAPSHRAPGPIGPPRQHLPSGLSTFHTRVTPCPQGPATPDRDRITRYIVHPHDMHAICMTNFLCYLADCVMAIG